MPQTVDKQLAALGATRAIPLILADELNGQAESFSHWTTAVVSLVAETCETSDGLEASTKQGNQDSGNKVTTPTPDKLSENAESVQQPTPDRKARRTLPAASAQISDKHAPQHPSPMPLPPKPFKFKMGPVAKPSSSKPASSSRDRPFTAKLVERSALSEDGSLIQVTFDVSEYAARNGVRYQPGDNLGVFPRNSDDVVEHVLLFLDIGSLASPDEQFVLERKTRVVPSRLRKRTWTARSLLKQAVELRRPGSALLSAMFAVEMFSHHLLSKHAIATAEDLVQFADVNDLSLNQLLEHLVDAGSPTTLRFETLLAHCQWIQQRLYSIASSPKQSPERIDLTVRLLMYTVTSPKGLGSDSGHRVGFATSFMATEDVGCPVELYIRSNPAFHPKGKHVVLIGAGSGVAPFRGFWQHWQAHPGEIDRAVMFLGWRSQKSEAYHHEIKHASASLGMGETGQPKLHVCPCYSRQPGTPKTYVQDGLLANSSLIWSQLEAGATVYVCGQSKMAHESTRMIDRIAGENGVSNPQHFSSGLVEQGRLHLDVFTDRQYATEIPASLVASPFVQQRRMSVTMPTSLGAWPNDPQSEATFGDAVQTDAFVRRKTLVMDVQRRATHLYARRLTDANNESLPVAPPRAMSSFSESFPEGPPLVLMSSEPFDRVQSMSSMPFSMLEDYSNNLANFSKSYDLNQTAVVLQDAHFSQRHGSSMARNSHLRQQPRGSRAKSAEHTTLIQDEALLTSSEDQAVQATHARTSLFVAPFHVQHRTTRSSHV